MMVLTVVVPLVQNRIFELDPPNVSVLEMVPFAVLVPFVDAQIEDPAAFWMVTGLDIVPEKHTSPPLAVMLDEFDGCAVEEMMSTPPEISVGPV